MALELLDNAAPRAPVAWLLLFASADGMRYPTRNNQMHGAGWLNKYQLPTVQADTFSLDGGVIDTTGVTSFVPRSACA